MSRYLTIGGEFRTSWPSMLAAMSAVCVGSVSAHGGIVWTPVAVGGQAAPGTGGGQFNGDTVVDLDYLDFVDAFAANSPSADFNGDSIIDFFDYLDFVDALSTGC